MQLYSQSSLQSAEYPIGEEVIMLDSTRYREGLNNPRGIVGIIVRSHRGLYVVDWSNGFANNSYLLGVDIGFTAKNVLCVNKVKYRII